jgi:hypothetical protein
LEARVDCELEALRWLVQNHRPDTSGLAASPIDRSSGTSNAELPVFRPLRDNTRSETTLLGFKRLTQWLVESS